MSSEASSGSGGKGSGGTCLLLVGDRVVLRANAPPEAEYAMFEIGEIELRASEPGRVREHGYQTTVGEARTRLAHLGLSAAIGREFALAMQPTLSDAYARGLPVRRVARYLGALELFQSDHYDANAHVYRGVYMDLAGLSRDLELEHVSATIHAIYLATLLESEGENTRILLSTDACTKSGKPGARTFKRPAFADVKRALNALGGLAHKNPKPEIHDALPRADVIAFLRSRADVAPDEDARALYRSLEGSVSLRDMPERGPLASPDLWAIETRIDAGDIEGTLDTIDEAERRHGRTPGTTYLRARISLAMRLEPPKLIAERVSALALSMTSFQELALLAAESWLEAGDPRRAMPYARDLVDAPGVDEGLLLRAQRLLARAVGAAPQKKHTLVDVMQAAQPSRPPMMIADEMARALAVLAPPSPLDDEPLPQSLDPQDLVPLLPSDPPPLGPPVPPPAPSSRPAASSRGGVPPPLPSSRPSTAPKDVSKTDAKSGKDAKKNDKGDKSDKSEEAKATVKRRAVTKGWEEDPPPFGASTGATAKDKKQAVALPSSGRKLPSAAPLPPPPDSARKIPSLGPPPSSRGKLESSSPAPPATTTASSALVDGEERSDADVDRGFGGRAPKGVEQPSSDRSERLSSIPPLRSKPSAAEVVPQIPPPPLDLDLPPVDPTASFTLELPGPESLTSAKGAHAPAESRPQKTELFSEKPTPAETPAVAAPLPPPPSTSVAPKPSRRPRLSGVMMETRPPTSFDPRAEPDSPMIPRIAGVPLDLESSRRTHSPVPSPLAGPARSSPSSTNLVAAKKASSRPPSRPPVRGGAAARPQDTGNRGAPHDRPTPLRPPTNDVVAAKPGGIQLASSGDSSATPTSFEVTVAPSTKSSSGSSGSSSSSGTGSSSYPGASASNSDRSFMHGASLPPYRHENPPPLLPKAPLLPKLGTSSDELAEHLALPPGLGNDPHSLEVLPTSVLEARVQFTLLARELGLDYRLKRGIDLRADMSGIEAMQSVLLESFPDRVVRTSDEAYELRRHGALLSEILARRLEAEWLDISPNELGYWVMIVPPDTRVWPFGRVARLVAMGHKERDLVSYFLELQARARGR